MGGVDDHHVHARLGELLHAREVALAAGDGGRDAQAELLVAIVGGVLVLDEALHVGEGVEADDVPGLVDERQLAHLVGAHDVVGLLEGGAGLGGDGVLLHHVAQLRGIHRGVAHVGAGDHADEAVFVVEDGEAVEREAEAALLRAEEGDVVVRVEADGLGDEAVEVVLDLRDLGGLGVLFEVLVDHADAAGKGHRDGHRGLGDGVHGRRDERHLHLLTRGELRLERGVVRQEIGILRHERDVVVGETLERKGLHECVKILVDGHACS